MKNKCFILFVTALFFISRPLLAQDQSLPGSTQGGTKSSGGRYVLEQRYEQQLIWIGDQYTSKYELVVERSEGRTYSVILREFTEKAAFQISLPPGNYRYRVIPYDYLDQSGEPSKWVTLEIKPAPIVPVEIQTGDDGTHTIRSFDNETIIPGVIEIVIKNPDDLDIKNKSLIVDKKPEPVSVKIISFYVSAAWSPLIPLNGAMKNVFGSAFYFSGVHLRLGALYDKPDWWLIPGLELSASWYALNNSEGSNEITVQAGTTGINLVLQKKFFNRFAVSVRTGFAVGFQVGEVSSVQYKYSTGGIIPQVNLEASFLWFAWKQFYLEAGAGYSIFLNQNDVSGCLRPWTGAGWKF